jgi:hypothetical protein
VHQSLTEFKRSYDSVRWEVLCNIPIEFSIPVKMVRLKQICLIVTYNRVRVDKHLSHMLPFKKSLQKGDVLWPLLFNFAL